MFSSGSYIRSETTDADGLPLRNNKTFGDATEDDAVFTLFDSNNSFDIHTASSQIFTTYEDLQNHTSETVSSTASVDFYMTISYIVIGLVGVLGNSFSCAVIVGHRPLRTRLANYYIINQCVLDLLISFLLLTNMTTTVDYKSSNDALGYLNCFLWKSRIILVSLLTSSVYNIVAVTIERYSEIIHPIKHKIYFSRRIVIVSIVATWLIGASFKISLGFRFIRVINGVCIGGLYPNLAMARFVVMINFVFEYFVSLAIIAFCYIRMGHRLIGSVAPSTTVSGPAGQKDSIASRARKNILKTLLSVSICLALTLLMKHILVIVGGFSMVVLDVGGPVHKSGIVLQFSNCCINPFIYMFQYKEFQKGVAALFRRFKKGNANATVHTEIGTVHTDV